MPPREEPARLENRRALGTASSLADGHMETSLHRELKSLYSDDESQQEVTLEGYRIDAVSNGRLVEIQYGSLAGSSRGRPRKHAER